MKNIIVIILLFSTVSIFSQLVKKNETLIFSFKTKAGKTAVLASDSDNKYIVYRFGTKDNIELEYPASLDNTSWQKFTYSYYYRGGGKMNAGMDLNYVDFTNNDYNYRIYNEYYSEDDSVSNGILVTDSKSNETDIKGINKTVKGSLVELRFNELISREK